MTRGKKTCKILKEIRQQIADKNDIEYITSECHFQGECLGTCPKCESEVRFLENELQKRKQLGKVATIAGISLGIASTFSACNGTTQQNTPDNISPTEEVLLTDVPPPGIIAIEEVDSIPPPPVPPELLGIIIDPYPLTGDLVWEPSDEEIDVLEGKPTEKIPTIKDTLEEKSIYYNVDPIMEEGEILFIVEKSPEFPGGDEARLQFIKDNLVYPEDAKKNGIQGTVYVNFFVEKDGSISNVKVVRGIGYGCDEEAVRVTKMMPNWIPGEQRGEKVRVSYNMPIKFVLPE